MKPRRSKNSQPKPVERTRNPDSSKHSALKSVERSDIPTCRDTPPSASEIPQSAICNPHSKARHSFRRNNGNVARLPKTIRDNINQMIEDGVTYPEIIKRLGDHGKDLKPDNLSQWKKRGYQDWLAEQAFIARIRARQETPSELVRDFDGTDVNHAALQLGTLHIFDALRDLGPGSLDKKLGGDCSAFARLLNALARASRETMLLQKYREACVRARAALQELKDPKRELNDEERRAIVRKVDEILGLSSEPRDDSAVQSSRFKVRRRHSSRSKPQCPKSEANQNPRSKVQSPMSRRRRHRYERRLEYPNAIECDCPGQPGGLPDGSRWSSGGSKGGTTTGMLWQKSMHPGGVPEFAAANFEGHAAQAADGAAKIFVQVRSPRSTHPSSEALAKEDRATYPSPHPVHPVRPTPKITIQNS